MKVVKRERITDALVDECNTMDNINARLPKPESEDETKWIASDNNNSPKWTSIAPTAGVVKTLLFIFTGHTTPFSTYRDTTGSPTAFEISKTLSYMKYLFHTHKEYSQDLLSLF